MKNDASIWIGDILGTHLFPAQTYSCNYISCTLHCFAFIWLDFQVWVLKALLYHMGLLWLYFRISFQVFGCSFVRGIDTYFQQVS